MYEFCYDNVKPKYGEKRRKTVLFRYIQFYYIHKKQRKFIKTLQMIETRFDTSNYELNKPLLKEKIKKVVWINER